VFCVVLEIFFVGKMEIEKKEKWPVKQQYQRTLNTCKGGRAGDGLGWGEIYNLEMTAAVNSVVELLPPMSLVLAVPVWMVS
jgi:hypothetical protein